MRPRVKGGKTKEVRAYTPVKQPIVETTDSHGTKTSFGMTSDLSTVDTDVSNLKSKQVSLRDLCVEDKKRVANLIKELARVVEEKENAEHNLASERSHYQEQILKLVEQQETVLKEREDVQNKLLEYQSLIVKLQQEQQLHHLRRQQEKHRKLQQKSPVKETKEDVPAPGAPLKGVKSKRSSQSDRYVVLRGSVALEEDVPQPVSQPKSEAQADYKIASSKTSDEEDENESRLEQPSQNLYMNMLEDSGVEDFSTQAHPAVSPSHGNEHPKAMSYRPFTTMIDRELAKQQAALSSMDHVFKNPNSVQKREERHAKKTEGPVIAKTSREIKSPSRASTNAAERAHLISHTKQDLKIRNVEASDANSEFIVPSRPFVSPEKAEIFSRFMHSQSKDDHHHRNEDLEQSERDQRVEEQEKRNVDLTDTRKHRKKRPPPASFGVLHPPIMSSTQKSSEIGDYVNSTINSDRKIVAAKEDHWHNKGKNEESDESYEEASDRKVIGRHEVENVDIEDNAGERAGRRRKSKHRAKPKVEFSDQLAMNKDFQAKSLDADNLLGVDPDYLSYYKNLSGTERKKELLKQRTKLLEEQNKLRKILADQESRLVLRQSEIVGRKEVRQDGSEQDKIAILKMQDSLDEMEFQVALKEEAIRKEKELIERRRREQAERHGAGLKCTETGARHSQGRDSHDEKEGPSKAKISPVAKLDSGEEILNKALILVEDEGVALRDVIRGGRTTQAETVKGVKNNKSNVLMEKDKNQPRQNGRQERESKTNAAKSVSPASNDQGEDDLARKLDYSFHSDADQPIPESQLEVKPQPQTFPDRDMVKVGEAVNTPSNVSSVEGKVDAGTSISFAHLGQNVTEVRDGENITGAEKSAVTETKQLTKSPDDKTMAVIEIINSLEDLDDLAYSKVDSVPAISLTTIKGRQEARNRKTKVLRNKLPAKPTANSQGLMKQPVGVKMPKPALTGYSPPSDNKNKHFPSLPFGSIKRQERFGHQHGLGSGLLAVSHVEDAELDFFHLPQFREERLDGCWRLANRDTDDDGNDITCEYDDNDDSNLDDIVNALSRSFITDEEEEGGGRKKDNVWEYVDSDSDDGYNFEFEENLHLDADCSSVDENRYFKSDREQKKYSDDNDILEEIFFVHP